MIEGGCFCGFIRYQVGAAPFSETNCHCSMCRRVSAAPFVPWFTVPRQSYRVVSGEPTVFRSSEHATRSFCPRCGTPLTFQSSRYPDEVDVTICSLADPERVPPRANTHVSSKLSWVKLDEDLPAFPASRST
jgi:hypothetical protein